jgi:uncharacterized protein (DUF1697 family)
VRYAVFLRAINVGTTNRVKMADLRLWCENLGFTRVSTYLQTGNILLESALTDPEEVAVWLEVMLLERGFKNVTAIVRSENQMLELLTLEPFADTRDGVQYVVLLRSPATLELPALPPKANLELIGMTRDAVFLWGERGLSHDVGFVQKKFEVSATTRHWNVVKVKAMAELLLEV